MGRTSQEVGVMPKEITYSDQTAFVVNDRGDEIPAGDQPPGSGAKFYQRGVQVGWARAKFVEVGVARFDVSREMPSEGVFTSLDREGINRLIRSLRRARDAAFGSDA
jgi:hypothetical protein